MNGPALIALALAFAAQPGPVAQPSENFIRAATLWGECGGRKALEFARRADPVEAVVTAVVEACRDAERETVDALTRDQGANMARHVLPLMRQRSRELIRQTVREARGAPRQRGPGDETRVWGECVGGRSAGLAAFDASPAEIASAAFEYCAPQERSVRAQAVAVLGEAGAGSYMESLRRQLRATALRRLAAARATD